MILGLSLCMSALEKPLGREGDDQQTLLRCAALRNGLNRALDMALDLGNILLGIEMGRAPAGTSEEDFAQFLKALDLVIMAANNPVTDLDGSGEVH